MKQTKRTYSDFPKTTPEKGKPDTIRRYEPVRPRGTSFRMIPFIAILSIILLIIGIIYFIMHSTPFQICEAFIKENKEIRAMVGDVVECDFQLPLEIDAPIGKEVRIRYSFDVKGTRGSTTVNILLLRTGEQWHILSASYRDQQGSLTHLVVNTHLSGEKKMFTPRTGTSEKGWQYLQAGHRFFKQNEFDRAIAEYTRLAEAEPGNYRAYFWRGRAFMKKNLEDQALNDFRKTIELNPHHPDAYNWLGWIYRKKNNCNEAIGCLTKSIELRPDNGWTFYNRGKCYHSLGNTQQALSDFRKSCALGYTSGCHTYESMKKP